jgi:hypothetical protein
MRNVLTSFVGAALLLGTPALAQEGSPTTAPPEQGAWAAEFIGLTNGPLGGSALLYTSPTAAWRLALRVSGSSQESATDELRRHDYRAELGSRWHAGRTGRVQPFTGIGISGRHQWTFQSSSFGSGSSEQLDVGAYGEIGAQIFVADEIALGSRWPLHLSYMHVQNGAYGVKRFRLLGGGIDVFAVIRF